jgi:protein SCO1/2
MWCPPGSDGGRRHAPLTRRRLGLIAAIAGLGLLGGCGDGARWHAMDVSGSSPPLEFAMTRSSDGKPVTEADYRGDIVLLYFGYTFCPDICPTTLANLDDILGRLGSAAEHIRVLFVTVDPDRDTPPVLAAYVKNFGPQMVGLRGTPDQLAALARRYRIVYSVRPATADHPYEVTHSSAIYVFDRTGAARLLVPSLASSTPDIAGTTADLRRLVDHPSRPGFWARLMQRV